MMVCKRVIHQKIIGYGVGIEGYESHKLPCLIYCIVFLIVFVFSIALTCFIVLNMKTMDRLFNLLPLGISMIQYYVAHTLLLGP